MIVFFLFQFLFLLCGDLHFNSDKDAKGAVGEEYDDDDDDVDDVNNNDNDIGYCGDEVTMMRRTTRWTTRRTRTIIVVTRI